MVASSGEAKLGPACSPEVEPDARHPFVSLHVPSYEEPPEMVIETLRTLTELDYDRYEIVAIDDNTKDESLWRPVEAWCLEHGVKFVHLETGPATSPARSTTRCRR